MVVVRLGCILSYRFLLQLQLLQMLFRCIDVCHTALRYLSIPSIYRIIISTSRAVVSCTVIVNDSFALFPTRSSALHVTIVSPIGNVSPECSHSQRL